MLYQNTVFTVSGKYSYNPIFVKELQHILTDTIKNLNYTIMNTKMIFGIVVFLCITFVSFGQVNIDYTGAELVLKYIATNNQDLKEDIINHPGYQHIINHSQKYSSNPVNEDNLRTALNGNGSSNGFDFTKVKEQKSQLTEIIQYLKDNEQEIIDEYSKLCLKYLPADYKQNLTVYYLIGSYDFGIASDNKASLKIDYPQFMNNMNELKFYLAHELFHVGFENYQPLPDIFKAKTVGDLKEMVMSFTMNEGLATLTPYHKRIEKNETSDYDYTVLLDSVKLEQAIQQFNQVFDYMNENLDKEITNEILGTILGPLSGGRLWYIVGCYMGLKIEEHYGPEKIQELIQEGPEKFFEAYYAIDDKK